MVRERRATWAWLALASAIGLIFALRTSAPALRDPFVVQDDVRQHLFWVPRLHDPALFRDDPIADYYAAQAPPAFTAVYYLLTLAVDAPTASKLLPLVLTLLLAWGGFALGRALFGRSDAAALGSVLLCWSAWQYDDLASASARSFALPLLACFFAALAADRRLVALAVLALQALAYPLGCAPMLAVAAIWLVGRPAVAWVVGLVQSGRSRSSGVIPKRSEGSHADQLGSPMREIPRRELLGMTSLLTDSGHARRGLLGMTDPFPVVGRVALVLLMTVVAVGLTVVGQIPAARYGPVVTADEARAMPEFRPGGRSTYFGTDPYRFWIESTRSGLALVPKDRLLGGLPALTIPFVLAMALAGWWALGRAGRVVPPSIPRRAALLVVILVASLGLFAAAHVLLFRLYLPARHVQFTLPIVWAFAGGLAWTLAAERVAAGFGPRAARRASAGLVLLGIGLLVAHGPPEGDFYVTGRHQRLYAYLRGLPPETRVAALPGDSSILPLFGQRAVLVSWEHALPYHPAYYESFQRRARALAQAYYAEDAAPLLALADREDIGVFVANLPQLERRRRGGAPLALEALAERCGAVRDRDLIAIPVECARRENVRR